MDTQKVFVMKNSHRHQMTQNITAAISKPLKYLSVIMFLSLEKLQAWNNFTRYTNLVLEIPAIQINWKPKYKIISWTKFYFFPQLPELSLQFVVSSCYNQECFTYDKEETTRMASKLFREDIATKLDDVSALSWPPTLEAISDGSRNPQNSVVFIKAT